MALVSVLGFSGLHHLLFPITYFPSHTHNHIAHLFTIILQPLMAGTGRTWHHPVLCHENDWPKSSNQLSCLRQAWNSQFPGLYTIVLITILNSLNTDFVLFSFIQLFTCYYCYLSQNPSFQNYLLGLLWYKFTCFFWLWSFGLIGRFCMLCTLHFLYIICIKEFFKMNKNKFEEKSSVRKVRKSNK